VSACKHCNGASCENAANSVLDDDDDDESEDDDVVYDDEYVNQDDSVMNEVYPLDADDVNDAIWSDEVMEFMMPYCLI
jgi:hypothetical protein